ncbi:MAG: MBL fold metallo-hydrolase [Gammaproteobacteria bacterium]|nr:MAG: MBL fold metallo-hydrolase [Gammaproteobacteria bacterium]
MRIRVVPVTPFQQNCSVLWCERTREAAIVDPGGDLDQVLAAVAEEQVTPVRILLTHGHLDHAGGTAELAQRCSLPIEGPHRSDRFLIQDLPQHAAMFGLARMESFEPTRWLEQGDRVQFGDVELQVRHCPGHTPGHVVYFHEPGRFAIVGDVLFQGSVGRTDLPGGDHEALIRSIRENLFPLGDDVRFLSGHGPMSTFGEERRSNPFVGDFLFARR